MQLVSLGLQVSQITWLATRTCIHPCHVDHKGVILLANIPGQDSRRYSVKTWLPIPTLPLDVDFNNKKPHHLTHFAIHRSGLAMGHKAAESLGTNYRVEKLPECFTPEVLRAARVFLKELSTGH